VAHADAAQLEAARQVLEASGEDPRAVDRLIASIDHDADVDLESMTPWRFARAHGLDEERVIDTFLRAARLHVLIPRWSLPCPSCRGEKGGTDDVAGLLRGAHCSDCNLSFDLDPREGLHLTFGPDPAIRAIAPAWTC